MWNEATLIKFEAVSGRKCKARGGGSKSDMSTKKTSSSSREIDDIVDELLHDQLSKADRIKLIKRLVKLGEELPDEVLGEALKRLMEQLLE